MQKKLTSSIGILSLLLLIPARSEAQLVIQPLPFPGAAGGSTGPLSCTGNGSAALPCYTGSTVNSGIYFSGTSTLISANGANSFTFTSGELQIHGTQGLAFATSGGPYYFHIASTVTGQLILTNGANSSGVGFDLTTDNILAVRDRAQANNAAVRASFYSSSAVSALTITANVIAPTSTIHSVGVGLIKTITVPATCTPTCTLQIIPTAAYTYDATGNINVPVGGGLALISKVMTFIWDGTKWSPSY